jgi:hypothetical protein
MAVHRVRIWKAIHPRVTKEVHHPTSQTQGMKKKEKIAREKTINHPTRRTEESLPQVQRGNNSLKP